MTKKSELAFTAILVPLDFLLVLAAAAAAHAVRFRILADVRPIVFELPFREYLLLAAGAAAIFIVFFALSGLYSVSGPRRLRIEISRIFLACSTATMTLIMIFFFNRELFSSRFIVLAFWFFAFVYVGAGRVGIRLLQRLMLRFDIGVRRLVLVGADDRTTKTLIAAFAGNPTIGYRVVKRVERFDDAAEADVKKAVETDGVDEIFIANPEIGREELARALGFAEAHHLNFKYSADLLATHAKNIEIGAITGVPFVEIKGTRLDGWGRIFKRAFDIVVSLLLIVLTSPIMLATALVIVLDSKGPVLFRKLDDGTPLSRIGEHGKPFPYFKFRSMKPGTDSQRYAELAHLDTRQGPLVKIKDDPRVTRVGKFIRAYSIDELPELFLVLAGKMSLVGPRPHLPEEVAGYKDHQRKVMTVKPGITGMAQVSGRADLDFEDEVRLDTWYIENWSPWLDMSILLKTPFAVFSRKGAS